VAAAPPCRIDQKREHADAYTQPNSVIETLVSGGPAGPRRAIAIAIVTINQIGPREKRSLAQ